MKYMGSKQRIGKFIAPIVLSKLSPTNNYVEPFCGGMNMMQYVPETVNRFANDSNLFVASMWKELIGGWNPPKEVTKDFYNECKSLYHPAHMVGYVGINCSYSGKWFGGYAGKTVIKGGAVRDYQAEAYANVTKQLTKLHGVKVCSKSYELLNLPEQSVVYCDPPYAGTTGYKDVFDSLAFWQWCRNKVAEGHTIFVSEYTAPTDFIAVWGGDVKSSLSANGVSGGSKISTEYLFMHESQAN